MYSGLRRAGLALASLLMLGIGGASSASAQDEWTVSDQDYGTGRLWLPDSYYWLRYNLGDGVGYHDGYLNLGAFVPLATGECCDRMLFFEPRMFVSNDGRLGVNTGLGYRHYLSDVGKLIGLSAWYDHDEGHRFTYDQLAGSFEFLARNWALRSNCYFPLHPQDRLVSEQFTYIDPVFEGRNILLGTIDRQREVALRGVDLELGLALPGCDGLWAYGGYYYFQDDAAGAAHGGKFRLNYQFTDTIGAGFILTDDRLFGTNAVVNVTLKWPGAAAPKDAVCPAQRLNILTERHDRVVVKDVRTHEQNYALYRETGQDNVDGQGYAGRRIDVVHVDASAAAGGDGSIGSPAQTLAEAESLAQPHSIVFVRTGTYTDSIILGNGQRLLGDGLLGTNPHLVSALQGVFQLPGQTNAPLPVLAPADAPFAVVLGPRTLGTEVAGFAIANGSPSALAGIGTIGSQGFYLHHNAITTPDGYGALLINPVSDGLWVNASAVDHAVGVFDSQITGNGFGGILVAHANFTTGDLVAMGIDPAVADFLPTTPPGDPPGNLTVEIRNNQITNNGTSAAESPLDASGVSGRFGVAVVSAGNTQVNATIADNQQISNNGPAGSTEQTHGGVGLVAGGDGRLTAVVSGNAAISNNNGTGVGMSAMGHGQLTATIAGNEQINGNSLVGVGAFAEDAAHLGLAVTGNQEINTNAVAGVAMRAEDTSHLTAEISGNQQINANGTSGALTSLDTSATERVRMGIVAAAKDAAVVDLTVRDNVQIAGNGYTGASGDGTKASGGVGLLADGQGIIQADIIGNTFDGNHGFALIGASLGNGSLVDVTVDDNEVINPAAAWITNPRPTESEANLSVGFALVARDQNHDALPSLARGLFRRNTLSGSAAAYDIGVSLQSATADGRIESIFEENTIANWDNFGIYALSYDQSSMNVIVRNGNRVSGSSTNLYAGINDDSSATIEVIGGNEFFAGNRGLWFRPNTTSDLTLTVSGNRLYGNSDRGLIVNSRDSSSIAATVSDNLFGTQAPGGTANGSPDADIAADQTSSLGLEFHNNQGDAASGFDFSKDAGATFNVNASGNNPAPTGP